MLTKQIEKRRTEPMQKEKQDQRKTPLLSPLTNRGKTNRTKSKTPTATCRNRGWSFTSRLMLWSVRSCQPNSSTWHLNNLGRSCSGKLMSPRRGMVQFQRLAFNANDQRRSRPGVQSGRLAYLFLGKCRKRQLPYSINQKNLNTKTNKLNTKTLTENPHLANLFSIILCQSHKTLANIGET